MLDKLHALSIRSKLIWLVLALLVIPWMGYYYVTEMRRFLIQGQKDALLLTANGIATVLNDRSELFNPETGVPEVLGEQNDLYAQRLDTVIQLDGQPDDWSSVQEFASYYTGENSFLCDAGYDADSFSLKNVMGYSEQYLYALFEVNDEMLVYRDPERLSLDSSDQIRMLLQRPNGDLEHYLLIAAKPGRMSTFLVDADWKLPLDGNDVTHFNAELAETEWGYRIELRMPRDIIGKRTRLGFFAVDVDDTENREIRSVLSTSPQISGEEPGQILIASPELTKILKGLDQPRSRIWILDKQQRVRAVVGGLSSQPPQEEISEVQRNWMVSLYQALQQYLDKFLNRPPTRFVDLPDEVAHRPDRIFTAILKGTPQVAERISLDKKAQIVVAGYPIRSADEILGAVVVEQSSNTILALQYQLLKSLTLVSILVFLFVVTILLVFAWRLTVRVRRLLTTTERAITAEGRVREEKIPDQNYPRDELGDLGRSINSMLKRLAGYTRYLEGMPDTLAHELNNPLNVVSSSLQILESDAPEIHKNKHMQRARNGVNRLRIILTNLTEAANLEEAMRDETKEPIELTELIPEVVDGYRSSNPAQMFELELMSTGLMIDGSSDYIVQMLDKLVDNAQQFSKAHAPIIIRVSQSSGRALLSVLNEGPEIPERIADRLFDPMVSFGKTNAKHSHLGLGLFVARLIAEYHEGQIFAGNRSDVQGVAVSIALPLTSKPGVMTPVKQRAY